MDELLLLGPFAGLTSRGIAKHSSSGITRLVLRPRAGGAGGIGGCRGGMQQAYFAWVPEGCCAFVASDAETTSRRGEQILAGVRYFADWPLESIFGN